MSANDGQRRVLSRRAVSAGTSLALVQLIFGIQAEAAETPVDRFDFLSTHGNSNCSAEFLDSIATMPATARLQGSCCSPMERNRYAKQVEGLTKYRAIADIPPDPYDIATGLAQKFMPYYDIALAPEEQQSFQYAMENSVEKGPCCCGCWRWKMYGGLAKFLIRENRLTGQQITEIWDLSDGCGGA